MTEVVCQTKENSKIDGTFPGKYFTVNKYIL